MQNKYYIYKIAIIVSLGGLLLGVSANISGASEFYRSYFHLKLGSFLEGIGVSMSMLSAFIGNFWAGYISDKIGRKKALMLAAILFGFCTLGSALAGNYTFFLLTRFIGGFGIGISLVVVPMFIAEFAPSEKRGLLVSFNQLNIGVGFLLAYALNSFIVNQVSDQDVVWRWMLGAGFIFPLFYLILLFFVPESPRWLIWQGRKEKAKKILEKSGGQQYAENVLADVKKVNNIKSGQKNSYGKQWHFLTSSSMRLTMLIGLSIAFFQMASGINSVMFFVPRIIRMVGFGASGSFLLSNLVGFTTVVMTIVSMLLIDRMGRKPLLVTGLAIMVVSSLMLAWTFKNANYKIEKEDIPVLISQVNSSSEKVIISKAAISMEGRAYKKESAFFEDFKQELIAISGDQSKGVQLYSSHRGNLLDATIAIQSGLALLCILCFVIGFSISLGPVTYLLLSEIFPAKTKGLAMSVAGTLNGLTSFIVTTLFPIELEMLGSAATFMIYGLLLFSFLILVIPVFPETKGKSLEEIEGMLIR